jgi:hypothetical protein
VSAGATAAWAVRPVPGTSVHVAARPRKIGGKPAPIEQVLTDLIQTYVLVTGNQPGRIELSRELHKRLLTEYGRQGKWHRVEVVLGRPGHELTLTREENQKPVRIDVCWALRPGHALLVEAKC